MIWRVCERFGIFPPDIKKKFKDNSVWQQAQLLAYENIREMEDAESCPL